MTHYKKPKISIITTVKNRWKYLKQSIPTILSQSYKNFEYIIVDYNCPQHSGEKAKKLFKDKRIKIVKVDVEKNDWNFCRAINKGFIESEGEYILYIDSDTILGEDFLKECLKKIRKNSFISGWKHGWNPKNIGLDGYAHILFLKREYFEKSRGYNEEFGSNWGFEDIDMFVRLKEKYRMISSPASIHALPNSEKEKLRYNTGKEQDLWKESGPKNMLIARERFRGFDGKLIIYKDIGYKYPFPKDVDEWVNMFSKKLKKSSIKMSFIGKILINLIGVDNRSRLDKFRLKHKLTTNGILSILIKAPNPYMDATEKQRKYILKELLISFFVKKVRCPICNWRGRLYLPIYIQNYTIKNVFCPRCGSHKRHRLQYVYIQKNISRDKKIRLLHFVPEKYLEKFLKSHKNIKYLSADIDKQKAIETRDIRKLTYKENSFDIIICSHVLEHIKEDRQTLKELYRTLKMGGFAFIMVPQSKSAKTLEDDEILPTEYMKYYKQPYHVRLYGQDFINRLSETGFDVKVENFTDTFTKREIVINGFDSSEKIFICTKSHK